MKLAMLIGSIPRFPKWFARLGDTILAVVAALLTLPAKVLAVATGREHSA